MASPAFLTINEMILSNMSRAEKRKSKESFDVCLEVVLFLGSKMQARYSARELREVAEEIHATLQTIEIPPRS